MKKIILSALFIFFPFAVNASSYSTGWNVNNLAVFGLPSGSISNIVTVILYWLLGIFGAIAVIGFVISGIMYIISSGDEDVMKSAKRAMIYSIVGVLVALSGLVIINTISNALNASLNTY